MSLITPVSTNTNISFSSINYSNALKLLERQKTQLQEQIQKTNQSKLDDKAKLERVKQLQEQIQQVDAEIQQKQNEKQNEILNQNQSESQQSTGSQPDEAATATDTGDSIDMAGMSNLIKTNATYTHAQIMNKTKNNLNRKGNILQMEIKLDEKRGGEAKGKRKELKEIQSKEQTLDEKVGETVQTAQNQVNEVADAASRNNKGKAGNKEKNTLNSDAINISKNERSKAKDSETVSESGEENSGQQELIKMGKSYNRFDIKV